MSMSESKGFFQRIRSFLTAEPDKDLEPSGKQEKREESVHHLGAVSSSQGIPYHIDIAEVSSLDETHEIANKMLSESALVLNLQSLNAKQAQEMLYFLLGVSYALGGHMEKISQMPIFLYKPKHLLTSDNMVSVPEQLKVAERLKVASE